MRERGVKVLLMGHVPPARTGSKQLWDETCWQKYTLWLQQYRDVIIGAFYGHMNIDHFLLHDTHDIDYKLIGVEDASDEKGEGAGDALFRTSMDDELDMASTTDYLQELRSGWSKLPKPATLVGEEDVEEEEEEDEDEEIAGKKKKNKKSKHRPKLSRKWGERYQVSLVSPSIVPNYLPTMRIFEYDISGLEHVPVWTEGAGHVPVLPDDGSFYDDAQVSSKKGKKGKKDKKKKKTDPSPNPNPKLEMPEGPSKTSPIGPAYSVQPLSLLGYTQYFANLTHINNDMTAEEADDVADANKWREGKHSGKEPQARPAKPHKFEFKVEYSTFKDKIYNLPDLTVNSFLEMGYRMGQKGGKTDVPAVVEEDSDREEEDVTIEKKGKKGKKGKKDKKKKKKAEQNKVWLHFLRHAFVTTVDEKELQKTYS